MTLGVQASRPATEYGYLIPDLGQRQVRRPDARRLASFEEKPTAERAAELLRQAGVAWNAGMFMWQRRAIRQALEQYAPDVMAPLPPGFVGRNR